jgi:hypothetical protein
MLLRAAWTSPTIRREHSVAFLGQQWLREHTEVLRYAYIAYIVVNILL